jgi:hypothetical protein
VIDTEQAFRDAWESLIEPTLLPPETVPHSQEWFNAREEQPPDSEFAQIK